MAGGGGNSSTTTTSSTSSGRAHFRSPSGCCICGTKSSSSRFTASQRYSEHFADCFGALASTRAGDLCNACVLCVKRWLQRDRKPHGLFSQVLDSKKGAGPKHMKEITKRARRREARQAHGANKKPTNVKSEPPAGTGGVTVANMITTPTRHVSATLSGFATSVPTATTSTPCCCVSTGGPSLTTRSTTLSAPPTTNTGLGPHRSTACLDLVKGPTIGQRITEHAMPSSRAAAAATSITGTIHINEVTKSNPHHMTCTCCWSSLRTRQTTSSGTTGACGQPSARSISNNSPPEGATLTRAAAARKSEAAIVRALSCSTPARHSTREPASTVWSETSDYGSRSSTVSANYGFRGTSLAPASFTPCCCCCCCCCLASTTGGSGGVSKARFRCALNSSLHACQVCEQEARSVEHEQKQEESIPCKRTKYDIVVEKRRNGSEDSACPPSPASNCCHCCVPCLHHACSGWSCSPANSTVLTPCPSTKTTNSVTSLTTEFRHPPPPSSSSSNSRLLSEPNSNSSSAVTSPSTSCSTSATDSASASSTPGQGPPSTRRYNRRVVLPPVRMTQNEDVNLLLREIMELNSQAINFDPREMHMAVQKRLRSRNAHANSGSISGRASSISSTDGSVDTGCVGGGAPRTPDAANPDDNDDSVNTQPQHRCSTHGTKCPHSCCCCCCSRLRRCHHCHHCHIHHHYHHHHHHSNANTSTPSVTTRRT